MKKYFLIIMAVIGVIAGCKLDDAGFKKNSLNNSTSSLLIGKWFEKAVITTDPITGINTELDSTSQDYYQFNTDNTVKVFTSPDSTYIGHYTYVNPKLILSQGNDSITWTVQKLTADSLIMSTIFDVTATVGPTTTNYSFKATYKLTH